jgi:hypothetical protein
MTKPFAFALLVLMYFQTQVLFCQNTIPYVNKVNDKYVLDSIIIKGNKITRIWIINRELPFRTGDTILHKNLKAIVQQTHDNLMNTSLFNFVTIDTSLITGQKIKIFINVKERWYTWPLPIFEISDRNFNTWWERKDFNRINYGLYLVQENFRGRREMLKFLIRFGFEEKFSVSFIKPYINKSQTIGIGFTTGYEQAHSIAYVTQDNKQLFYKDPNQVTRRNFYSGIQITYRKGIYSTHTLGVYYDKYFFSDTILCLNPDFATGIEPQYFTLYYKYENDHRDYKTYPLIGYYGSFEIEKKGTGLLKNEKTDILSIKVSARKYWILDTRLFFSSALFLKYSYSRTPSYFTEQGLGYGSETVRSFEYYVIDGQNFALVKTQLKYQLLRTKILHLNFLPLSKFNTIPIAFYLNLYYDGGYISQKNKQITNNLSNLYLYGGGIGLDFVTYYDQVLRFEYSINMMKEHGLFVHFTSPF